MVSLPSPQHRGPGDRVVHRGLSAGAGAGRVAGIHHLCSLKGRGGEGNGMGGRLPGVVLQLGQTDAGAPREHAGWICSAVA